MRDLDKVVLSKEEYETLVRALQEAVSVAKEAVRQRDELLAKLRRLERKRGGRNAGKGGG